MTGSWTVANNKIVYHREIQLKKTWLSKDQFNAWNNDIEKLDEFYNTQLTLTQ